MGAVLIQAVFTAPAAEVVFIAPDGAAEAAVSAAPAAAGIPG